MSSGDEVITDVVRRTCEMVSTCQVRGPGVFPGIQCHRLIPSDNSIEVFGLNILYTKRRTCRLRGGHIKSLIILFNCLVDTR